jgi:2,3-dihydroxybenzoate decarboxylase
MFAGQPALGGPVWAWTADTAAHALRLIFSGLFERFPRLKVVLGHMGEALPFLLWRIDDRHELDIGEPIAPERRPSFFFRRNFVVTTSGVCDTLPVLHGLAALGADNVLFSVDYPYQDSRQAGDFLDRLAVSDAMREAIASGNARRLLKLHEP